ncbi:MAG TPA: hypothetical protein VIW24_07365 [Aldersonia sp.]
MDFPWGSHDVLDLPTVGDHVDTLALGHSARSSPTTGMPDSVATADLVTLPYPTRFGLFRASSAIAPFLSITNRMIVVRWTESGGRKRTLLFEPSDHEFGRYTPYFADRSQADSRFLQFFPSSELTGSWTNPGTKPTFTHGHITQ